MKSLNDLELENAELRERLKALTGDDDLWMRLRAEFGIKPRHVPVMCLLLKRAGAPVRVTTLYDEAFLKPNGEGPVVDSVKIAICEIRTALRKRGAPEGIVTIRGLPGYAMTSDLKTWIEARMDARAVAA